MPEPKSQFFVVGITHVDLAWKRGRAEMSEMMEIVVVRLLDLLEQNPDFRYHVEQAAHFRALQKRRPDLIARLKPHLLSGRLEFVGGMASTLEANLPNGECLVRNQHIGLQWVQGAFGVDVQTGWMIDAFGIPAQYPQILRGFGIGQFMACRFGGSHTYDLFIDRGLDGTEVMAAGWGSYAAFIRPENVSELFCKNWGDIDQCFAKADTLSGPGPFMVIPYTENEMLVSAYPQQLVQQRKRERPEQTWQTATPCEFFEAVARTGRTLPVVHGDLNPEFTGCFSLRHPIRLTNRRVETRLLEAEKWAALAELGGNTAIMENLADAWWELSFVQFHDVFTGSHPTEVFHHVMRVLAQVEEAADAVLVQAFAGLAAPQIGETVLFNGLPWNRADVAEIPLPTGWANVSRVTGPNGEACPFVVENAVVRVRADVPAMGYCTVQMEAGAASQAVADRAEPTEPAAAVLENEWVRMAFDTVSGINKLTWKPTGETLMEAESFLAAQRDDGNFQIENPAGTEVWASTGTLFVEATETTPLGQTVRLSGAFPPLGWAGQENHLHWTAVFFLPADRPEVRVSLHLDWKGEGSRLRFVLPTLINSATGIYEVPFGVAHRKPYSPRTNAKGEWPAHRFVALQDARHGVALVNTGVGGVEVSGGTLYTTLLRAPKSEYAGMVSDATSSQHGPHDYSFALVAYAKTWNEAGVAQVAQELNNPLLPYTSGKGGEAPQKAASASFFRLEPANVVLSGVKPAADGSGDRIVRVYETAGRETDAVLSFPSGDAAAGRFFRCDLRETTDAEITVAGDVVRFSLRPFQIQTLRWKRETPG